MKTCLTKTMSGFIPSDEITAEWYKTIKVGEVVHSDFRKMRNPKFHKKGFTLLKLAFDYWEPGEINSKYGIPEKNFDRFRKDLTILAGFYHLVIRLDGTTRIEADSLSFGSMSEEKFEKVYNSLINVVLKKIPVLNTLDENEMDELVNEVLQFA